MIKDHYQYDMSLQNIYCSVMTTPFFLSGEVPPSAKQTKKSPTLYNLSDESSNDLVASPWLMSVLWMWLTVVFLISRWSCWELTNLSNSKKKQTWGSRKTSPLPPTPFSDVEILWRWKNEGFKSQESKRNDKKIVGD